MGAATNDPGGLKAHPTSLKICYSEREEYNYFMDGIFTADSSQADIFEEIKPFVQSSLDGDNVCIFAYG